MICTCRTSFDCDVVKCFSNAWRLLFLLQGHQPHLLKLCNIFLIFILFVNVFHCVQHKFYLFLMRNRCFSQCLWVYAFSLCFQQMLVLPSIFVIWLQLIADPVTNIFLMVKCDQYVTWSTHNFCFMVVSIGEIMLGCRGESVCDTSLNTQNLFLFFFNIIFTNNSVSMFLPKCAPLCTPSSNDLGI